jgi:TPR repeat protein
MFRIGIFHILIAILCFSPLMLVSAADSDGWQALRRGDYDLAEKVWLPRAQRGEVEAQLFLGYLETMRERYDAAARWYQRAAAKGNATAQALLASQYLIGQGVDADPVRAFAWYELAASQGHVNAVRAREATARQMTAEEVEAASRLVEDWMRDGPPTESE